MINGNEIDIFFDSQSNNKNNQNSNSRNNKKNKTISKKKNKIISIKINLLKFKIFKIYSIIKIFMIVNHLFFVLPSTIDNQITIKINGTGTQAYISSSFANKPDVYYDGNLQTVIDNNKIEIRDSEIAENSLILMWHSSVDVCDGMFEGMENLIEIDLSKFSPSQCKSMKNMFSNDKNLKNIIFGSFDTSLCINMKNMFKGCSSLTSLDLNSFNTELVTDMSSMFDLCTGLEVLNVSNFITSNVITMSNMFTKCEKLTSLVISNFNTTKVTNMNNMFTTCRKLTYINLSNFDTSNVKYMKKMFDSCNSLLSLDISSFNTEKVEDMGTMFSGCYSLTSIDLSNFNTESTTNMKQMFLNCKSLISLNLSNFNTINVLDMTSMFQGCLSLSYLNFFNFEKNSDLTYENMFLNVDNNVVYCFKEESNLGEIKSLLEEKECSTYDCNDNWLENKYNLIEEKKNDFTIFTDKCIYNDIKDISDNFFISNKITNTSIYSYDINNNEIKDKYTNVTYIDFSQDDIDFIYNYFNLDKEKDKIYILMADSLSNDSRKATSDFNYVILLENGTQLNLSNINQDVYIDVSVPLRDLDLANFNYAKYFNELGYDIYNSSSDFYKDYCISASSGDNDIILEDRKKDIYPNNVTLCSEGCEYKSVNIEEQRIVCECNLNNNGNIEDEETNVEEDEGNYFTYFLDKINYKIFKCHKLFILDNLIHLLSFYVLIAFFILILFLGLFFLFSGLSNIRIQMNKYLPTEQKLRKIIIEELKKYKKMEINNSNPLKKNKNNIKENKQIKIINTSKLKNNKNSFGSSICFTGNIAKKKNIKNNDRFITINPNKITKKSKLKKSPIKETEKEGIKEKDDLENLNDLPYGNAIKIDKRNIFQVFKSVLFNKLDLIDLIFSKKRIKIICICEYMLSLLFGYFFNALLYSDDVVSQKYHNNGELDSIVSITLSLISNIITSIVCHYIEYSSGIEEYLDNIIEIRNEYKFLYALNKFFKYLKIKLILFLITIIILVSGCFYYIVIFCIIYSKSQKSLFINYIYSQIESLITALIITLLIVITRQFGIKFSNVYLYNISKYIDHNI